MSKSKIENIKCATLWSLKIYGGIVVKLKVIKYQKDFFCYLSSYLFFRPRFLGHLPFNLIL